MSESSCRSAMHDAKLKALGIDVDRSSPHWDLYSGGAKALLAAGILSPDRLPRGNGRGGWRAAFMPNGSPHPKGIPALWALPGFMTVAAPKSGIVDVRVAVPIDEQQRRSEALKAAWIADRVAWRQSQGAWHCERENGSEHFHGQREQLLEMGVPARWMEGAPKPGKASGGHTLYDGGRKIVVRVNSCGEFSVEARSDQGHQGEPCEALRRQAVDAPLPSNVIPFPVGRRLASAASCGDGL